MFVIVAAGSRGWITPLVKAIEKMIRNFVLNFLSNISRVSSGEYLKLIFCEYCKAENQFRSAILLAARVDFLFE